MLYFDIAVQSVSQLKCIQDFLVNISRVLNEPAISILNNNSDLLPWEPVLIVENLSTIKNLTTSEQLFYASKNDDENQVSQMTLI